MSAIRFNSTVTQGEDVWTAAYVTGQDGQPVLDAQVEDWRLQVFVMRATSKPSMVYELVDQASSVIMETAPTTGGGWTANSAGYTMRHVLQNALVALQGGFRYQLVYRINTGTLYGYRWVIHTVDVEPRL